LGSPPQAFAAASKAGEFTLDGAGDPDDDPVAVLGLAVFPRADGGRRGGDDRVWEARHAVLAHALGHLDVLFDLLLAAVRPGPPNGSSFRSVVRAAWNAGEAGLMPVPAMLMAPPGSGKLVTPCSRMHWLYAIAESAKDFAAGFLLDEPQAASTSAQQKIASAITRPWRAPGWCIGRRLGHAVVSLFRDG
jgi:hypothetical protein